MKKHLLITFVLFQFQLVTFAQTDLNVSHEKTDKKSVVTSDSTLGVIFKDGNLELFINENGRRVQKSIIISFELGYQKDDDYRVYSINGNKITAERLDLIMGKSSIAGDIYIYQVIIKDVETQKNKIYFNKAIKVSFLNL